jgi:cell division transport system ATP-binding protein
MLKFDKVSKSFGNTKALSETSFEIEKGEMVFLTGPSGSGKTTILRLILAEITPDKGKVIFDGKDLTQLKPKDVPNLRRQIGVVFQDFKVLFERTVYENVMVALAVGNADKNEWNDRIMHVLKLVDLEKKAQVFPSQLSGGELQRVTLARALVVNPKIILADEPTGNLDWETAESIMDLFEKINKEGKTLLVATHHKLLIDKMKKRTLYLKDGELLGGKEKKDESPDKDRGEKETENDKEK